MTDLTKGHYDIGCVSCEESICRDCCLEFEPRDGFWKEPLSGNASPHAEGISRSEMDHNPAILNPGTET